MSFFYNITVVASNDGGRMEAYGAVQNDLIITKRYYCVDVI